MKTLCILFLVVAFVFVATMSVTSQMGWCSDTDGGYAGAFLRIGTGARALGMGSAFCAISDDASAIAWNPAGLAPITGVRITGTYAHLSFDRAYNNVIVANRFGKVGTIAAGWIGYSVADIVVFDAKGTPTKFFDDSENALLVSYSREVISWLFAGASVKYLSHKLGDYSASGYGFDFGVIVRPREFVSMGAAIQDVGSHFKWDTESKCKEDVPMVYRVGVALTYPKFPVTLTADYEKRQDIAKGKRRAGLEVSIYKLMSFRAGYDESIITAGASLSPMDERYSFGYAFREDFIGKESAHFFSLSIGIDR